MIVDYKKVEKNLYLPQITPNIVEVPSMSFLMVDGKGDPNNSAEYQNAMELLYGVSYTIKMKKIYDKSIGEYFKYVIPPLEGLWWMEVDSFNKTDIMNKDKFQWTMMIRQPEFVTKQVVEDAKEILMAKKKNLDISKIRLEIFEEGLCAQVMHIGPFEEEPKTVTMLEEYIKKCGYKNDIFGSRKHHEIYIGDVRRVPPSRLKTVIRHPIGGVK